MIALTLDPAEGDAGFVQPLAGGELWSATPIAAAARPAERPAPAGSLPSTGAGWRTIFAGEALDGGRMRQLVCALAAGGERRIDYDDGESYVVAADGGAIHRVAKEEPGAPTLERALGAPLALALALRGIYLLHASALLDRGVVVALTADSGGGKSTLAAGAARHPEFELRRVADDILPVRLGAQPVALPHFPQLKLPAAEGYPADAPARWPLAALVELERGAAEPEARRTAPRRSVLEPAAATLALARATVAARLFDERLLVAHLEACAAAAGGLRVLRLAYASGLDRLGEALGELVRRSD